ncbi:IS3 family transposase [Pseudoalteromonas sp. Cnat2-41]|uniref:IS3 family transposase n=1 Tax=unclassified Pseudoalteromonas TaxID=194690 RepID=UPI002E22B6D9
MTLMCRALKVSRSGFYRYLRRKPSDKAQKHTELAHHVKEAYEVFKARYGAPRLTYELNASGVRCSLNTVAKIMQELALKARNGKAFRYSRSCYSNSNVEGNVLVQQFITERANRKGVSDITYIRVRGQWLYLAAVMDLLSRAIVGWALDTSMTVKLISDAFNMALARREVKPGLMLHSDRGVQYRAVAYQDLVRSSGAIISMSRKSNCWDNAVMESFFSRLKVELVYAEKFHSIQHVKSCMFEYIEIFYNRKRRHSALGYLSPLEYEQRFA